MKLPWILLILCLAAQVILIDTEHGPELQGGVPSIQESWVDYEPLCFQDENQTIHLYLDFGLEHGPRGPSGTQAFLYWDEYGEWMVDNWTRWTYRRALTRVYEELPLGHQHFVTQLQWDLYSAHWETFYNEWGEEFGGSRTWFYLNITTPEGWRTAGWFYPFHYENLLATRAEFELPPWAYTAPWGEIITQREIPCGGVDYENELSDWPTVEDLIRLGIIILVLYCSYRFFTSLKQRKEERK